jgi:large subunit ribosomal protein L4
MARRAEHVKIKLLNLDGSAAKGEIELSDDVFGLTPRADILHRVVTWQLENRRGIARATRERSDVARTGKKFGNQKGGGTARHGDRAAPVFIGGGKAHGARRREFNPSLNKKVRALGLRMALSAKAQGGLVVVDTLDIADAKTKALGLQLAKANWGRKVLVIDGEAVNEGFARAAGNLPGVNVLPAMGANVYDILKHDTLVLTRAAVERLEARFALPGGAN